MFLTRQDALYGIVALPLIFLVGISTAGAVVRRDPSWAAVACLCCGALFLALSYRRREKNAETSQYRLRLRAYEQVARLTSSGYDMLVPRDTHPETARLLITMEEGNAVIKKETWRGVWHFYAISPDGELKLGIWEIDGELTAADREWLHEPLTSDRMNGLVTALHTTYTPRRRVTAMP